MTNCHEVLENDFCIGVTSFKNPDAQEFLLAVLQAKYTMNILTMT